LGIALDLRRNVEPVVGQPAGAADELPLPELIRERHKAPRGHVGDRHTPAGQSPDASTPLAGPVLLERRNFEAIVARLLSVENDPESRRQTHAKRQVSHADMTSETRRGLLATIAFLPLPFPPALPIVLVLSGMLD